MIMSSAFLACASILKVIELIMVLLKVVHVIEKILRKNYVIE